MPDTATADQPAAAPLSLSVSPAELHSQQVPYLSQYFGVWAMQESPFRSLCRRADQLNLSVHLSRQTASGGSPLPEGEGPGVRAAGGGSRHTTAHAGYDVLDGGIALVELSGTLMKHASSFGGGASTVEARRQIRHAAADTSITAILLRIDSPGGTVAGTADLAADVAAATQQKTVIAQCEDLCASAAYWIASQCTRIVASSGTTLVGSIGTYAVVEDWSQYAENEGLRVHVVRAGAFKGAGVPGTEVTDEQLAEVQRNVDALNSHFLEAVGRGRKMARTTVSTLADGRVHIAAEALRLGLIDAVQSLDDTLTELRTHTSQSANSDRDLSRSADTSPSHTTAPAGASPSPAADSGHTSDSGPPPADAQENDSVTTQTADPNAAAPAAAQTAPAAASFDEIVAACAGIDCSQAEDAMFVMDQQRQKASVQQASAAWQHTLIARTKAARQEAEEARAASQQAAQSTAPSPQPQATKPHAATGVTALADDGDGHALADGDPVETFNSLVDANVKKGMRRPQAVAAVVRSNPGLHTAMLEAHNAAQGRSVTLPSAYR